jgi:hypothetical protein
MRMCNSARIGVDDNDCFLLSLSEGDTATVSLNFENDDGDLDLRLMDPNEVILDVSDSEEDSELVSAAATFDGDHIVCVDPIGRSFQSVYSIDISIEQEADCFEDEGEASGDDTCEEVRGTPELLAIGVEAQIQGRTICEANSDFYAVTMRTGQDLTATMTRTSEGDDFMSIAIQNSDCATIAVAQTLGPERSVTFRAPIDGTFFVRVFGELDDYEGSYDLSLLLEGGDSQCPLDTIGEEGEELVIEPNDNAQDATLLNSFGLRRDETLDLTALSICEGDEDIYRIITDVPADLLSVTLRQSDFEAPLRLELLDGDAQSVLAATEEDLPAKSIDSPVLEEPGSYYIRVVSTGQVPQSGIQYTLSVELRAGVQCVPDAFEPNNIREGAALVSNGTIEATMCRTDPNERDYYSMLLNVGDRISISLSYDHDVLENMFALLTGPGGEDDLRDIAAREGNTDRDSFGEFLVGPNDVGEWIIEVDSSGVGVSLDYTLTVSVISPTCDTDDEDLNTDEDFEEPNDSCEDATLLEFFTPLQGFICGPTQDEDFFEVEVAPNQATLTVGFDYFHFDGNLDLQVTSPDDEFFLSGNTGEDFEEVVIDDPVPGTYCIRVYGTSLLTQNDYNIEASVQSD